MIPVRGTGISIQLDIQKDKFDIGPVLPYDAHAFQKVEIRNLSEFDTEIYSLDFDAQYLKEEEALRGYSEFASNEESKDKKKEKFDDAKKVYAEVRAPGQPFWDFIAKDNEKRLKRELLQKKLDH